MLKSFLLLLLLLCLLPPLSPTLTDTLPALSSHKMAAIRVLLASFETPTINSLVPLSYARDYKVRSLLSIHLPISNIRNRS